MCTWKDILKRFCKFGIEHNIFLVIFIAIVFFTGSYIKGLATQFRLIHSVMLEDQYYKVANDLFNKNISYAELIKYIYTKRKQIINDKNQLIAYNDQSKNIHKHQNDLNTSSKTTNVIKPIYGRYTKKFKIAIIMSYEFQDPCGRPQELGLTSEFNKISPDIFWHMEAYYMRVKTVNISQKAIENQARKAIKFVKEEVKPDVVVTIDDVAFRYVGGPLSKEGYKVYATGLNYDKNYYKGIYNENNTTIVFEKINPKKFIDVLLKSKTMHYFDKCYILTSSKPTLTELKIISEYKSLMSPYLPTKIVKFKTLSQLTNFLKDMNDTSERYIYMLSIQRLYNDYLKIITNRLFTLRYITLYNKRHLDFASNSVFVKYANVTMTSGPDFFEMGKLLAKEIADYAIHGKFTPKYIYPNNYLCLNINRIYNLKMTDFYNNIHTYINKIY